MLIIEKLDDGRDSKDILKPNELYYLNSNLNKNIRICEYISSNAIQYEGSIVFRDSIHYKIYTYKLQEDSEKIFLPNKRFSNLWDLIILDSCKKHFLLEGLLKTCSIKNNKILDLFAINKAVLIYGKPGLGKTTLAKALSHKLAIRMEKKIEYKEINCRKMISKFYGESLRLLQDLINDSTPDSIFVINEVESLMMSRKLIMNKNEPIDSIRIVNELLEIIDSRKFIFIFTSNYKNKLDEALLDRCDYFMKMKKLQLSEIYRMTIDCLSKMFEDKIGEYHDFMSFSAIEELKNYGDGESYKVYLLSKKLLGKSSRRIKKILFRYWNGGIKLEDYLDKLLEYATKKTIS